MTFYLDIFYCAELSAHISEFTVCIVTFSSSSSFSFTLYRIDLNSVNDNVYIHREIESKREWADIRNGWIFNGQLVFSWWHLHHTTKFTFYGIRFKSIFTILAFFSYHKTQCSANHAYVVSFRSVFFFCSSSLFYLAFIRSLNQCWLTSTFFTQYKTCLFFCSLAVSSFVFQQWCRRETKCNEKRWKNEPIRRMGLIRWK